MAVTAEEDAAGDKTPDEVQNVNSSEYGIKKGTQPEDGGVPLI